MGCTKSKIIDDAYHLDAHAPERSHSILRSISRSLSRSVRLKRRISFHANDVNGDCTVKGTLQDLEMVRLGRRQTSPQHPSLHLRSLVEQHPNSNLGKTERVASFTDQSMKRSSMEVTIPFSSYRKSLEQGTGSNSGVVQPQKSSIFSEGFVHHDALPRLEQVSETSSYYTAGSKASTPSPDSPASPPMVPIYIPKWHFWYLTIFMECIVDIQY